MKEEKIRKFDDTQRTDGSKTETTLSSVDTRGSWPIREAFQDKKIIGP